MAKNPLKKTKGAYTPEPNEKKRGIVKKIVAITATVALAAGLFFGGMGVQKLINDKNDTPTDIIVETPGDTMPDPVPPTPTPGGEVKGDVDTTNVILTEDAQMAIASRIYTDLRADIERDITTLNVEGTKLVQDGDTSFLQAYISITERKDDEQQEVLYVVGYQDIDDVKDIPNAEIRNVKAGTVADIQKYISIDAYVDEEKLDEVKDFIEERDAIEGVDELYVRVTSSNRKGNFTSTIDYVASLATGEISLGTIANEGQKYNVSYSELFDVVMNLNEVSAEKTNDEGMTK